MKNLLYAIVAVLGLVTLAGWALGDGRDRMKIAVSNQRNVVTVMVALPDVDERYDWLEVMGCAVELTDYGANCIEDGWIGRSGRSTSNTKQQPEIPFRDCPRFGHLQFTAIAKDRHGNVLASGQHTILRAF